jgi:hypothetical protein
MSWKKSPCSVTKDITAELTCSTKLRSKKIEFMNEIPQSLQMQERAEAPLLLKGGLALPLATRPEGTTISALQ